MNEHDYEPIPGLPAPLPADETILWQGAPDWKTVARRVMRLPLVLVWFVFLTMWGVASRVTDGTPFGQFVISASELVLLAAIALGLLGALAWLTARTTLYTITSRRVIMRFGIALPISIQIPFATIQRAELREWQNGAGDIAISLLPGERIGYLVLCPHARPWTLARAQPSFRSIADAATAARILGRALAASTSQPARAVSTPGPAPAEVHAPLPEAA
jgi:hypothetical protein